VPCSAPRREKATTRIAVTGPTLRDANTERRGVGAKHWNELNSKNQLVPPRPCPRWPFERWPAAGRWPTGPRTYRQREPCRTSSPGLTSSAQAHLLSGPPSPVNGFACLRLCSSLIFFFFATLCHVMSRYVMSFFMTRNGFMPPSTHGRCSKSLADANSAMQIAENIKDMYVATLGGRLWVSQPCR